MMPLEFARKYFRQFKQHGNEIIPTYCPFCNGGDKRDKFTFALNIENKTYNCKRGSCGKKGHFTELCREFGEQPEWDARTHNLRSKAYVKPKIEFETARKKVEAYLTLRGFSKETWERANVGEAGGNICFPYYENGELVMLKFRKPEKYTGQGQKAWREKGGKAVLWGIDSCKMDVRKIVIVEGEFDRLALMECGIENVVSVPSGAEDLSWIDLCWSWLEKFDSIVFWGDNDAPGQKMIRYCVKRLSDWKLYKVDSVYKDANESLVRGGKEKTAEAVEKASLVPKEGLLNLAAVECLDVCQMERVSCGSIKALNKTTGGFRMGELSVWTGKSGEGKSTLLGQILLDSINEGFLVCAYSGELAAGQFQYWLNLQAAGSKHIKTRTDLVSDREVAYVPSEIEKRIKHWYDGRFWLCDNTVTSTGSEGTSIIRLFTYAAKRYGCKVFLVDNLMTARFEGKSDSDYYRQQSIFVGQLVQFAKAYNVHVHLVAHPKKTNDKLDKIDISGSGDIVNRCDNAFAVRREEGGTIVEILKNRLFGAQSEFMLNFDPVTKRFISLNDVSAFEYEWERMEMQMDFLGVF